MKILLDENVWPGIWVHLGPHAVESVARAGWGRTVDRELMRLADTEGFGAILTFDQDFTSELGGEYSRLRVLILRRIRHNREPLIRAVAEILCLLSQMSPGEVEEFHLGEDE